MSVQPQSNTLLIIETVASQIQYYEQKLNKIPKEYNTSIFYEWPAIRDKEHFFIRKLANLKKITKDRELKNKNFKTPVVTKKQEVELKRKIKRIIKLKKLCRIIKLTVL